MYIYFVIEVSGSAITVDRPHPLLATPTSLLSINACTITDGSKAADTMNSELQRLAGDFLSNSLNVCGVSNWRRKFLSVGERVWPTGAPPTARSSSYDGVNNSRKKPVSGHNITINY